MTSRHFGGYHAVVQDAAILKYSPWCCCTGLDAKLPLYIVFQVLHRLLQPPIPPTVGGAEGGAEGGAGRKGESRRQALEVGGVKVS